MPKRDAPAQLDLFAAPVASAVEPPSPDFPRTEAEEDVTGRAPAQGGLFGDPTLAPAVRTARSPRAGSSVLPASVQPEHTLAARALGSRFRVGTSSWSFPGWAGLVYRERTTAQRLSNEGLVAYGQHPLLRTVGVDRTFYAPVESDVLAGYASQVPEDFRFLVKGWDAVTTPWDSRLRQPSAAFLDPVVATERCVRPFVDGLQERGGVLLFQFPPLLLNRLGGAAGLLASVDRFLAGLPTGVPYAIELRNAEVVSDAWFELLARYGVTHCVNSHPSMPRVGEQAAWLARYPQPQLVVRWMLAHNRSYDEAKEEFSPFDQLVAPDPETRQEVIDLVLENLPVRDALVVINNKAEGSSPLSAYAMALQAARQLEAEARSTGGRRRPPR